MLHILQAAGRTTPPPFWPEKLCWQWEGLVVDLSDDYQSYLVRNRSLRTAVEDYLRGNLNFTKCVCLCVLAIKRERVCVCLCACVCLCVCLCV